MRTLTARYDGEILNSICVRIQHALAMIPGSAIQFNRSEIGPILEFRDEVRRQPIRIVDIGEPEVPADT